MTNKTKALPECSGRAGLAVRGRRSVDGSRCLLARDAAEDHKVGHGVAAQAVAAVDAAGHFTRGEEAGDDLAFGVEDVGLGVDLQAAHGVVDTGGDFDSVVGTVVEGVGEAGAAEVGVVPRCVIVTAQ